ncbi:Oidioi.mRNA.OKI2018_I69.PAR.g9928.t1.cds [Oikopleura dioica]|uniref:Oidioi.mRNA.OKI2018_I69.PAR.g9928.t1.cds n=1 Tax=Oikopleura dioica TaxID=34765 RepID=A0ABN7RS66_OIKDI|nr:Oidioi.mRNA.OKI2018_I69.PAR.g9928.t1.cds [Oikopleura dioica]
MISSKAIFSQFLILGIFGFGFSQAFQPDFSAAGEVNCPRECDHFCVLKSTGPSCSCRSGFRLYDDLKTCVLTEELLEEAVQEMSDYVEFPVVIVLLAGFLVVLCMAIITWYCVTKDSPQRTMSVYSDRSDDLSSIPVAIKSFNKPLHISIV